LVLTHW